MNNFSKVLVLFMLVFFALKNPVWSFQFHHQYCSPFNMEVCLKDSATHHEVYLPSAHDEWFNQMITTLLFLKQTEDGLLLNENTTNTQSDKVQQEFQLNDTKTTSISADNTANIPKPFTGKPVRIKVTQYLK